MRIPLDYYRILGLPIQATVEQLQQAYRDRALQLPRREYSDAAIAARRALIDEAYTVLSNPDQRKAYDAQFLNTLYDSSNGAEAIALPSPAASDPNDPYSPSIEINDDQLVGALLVLLELGEYELVLKLGRPYLSSGTMNLDSGRYGDPEIVLADIVLTIAIACLELGREQWQQGQYESAAESLETGQELLLREGIFAPLRGEMQSDLYKLRPYRILELLSAEDNSPSYKADRQRGLQLLQDMLDERGGIDGNGDDQSGLSVDDFLKFIQQLRSYLTAAEQQALFETESRRPSAVATYLAVYALAARGFSDRQPALIRRAKLLLLRLGMRQDVYLEQAVCALLLGQTEEASRALEQSQEYDSLAFIREHSQDSPDLLPGLCLYGERWLQNEVFPHFRDLAQRQASLKEYFADEQVQAYLEELPNEPEPASQWTPATASLRADSYREYASTSGPTTATNGHYPSNYRYGSGGTATLDAPPISSAATMPIAERVSHGGTSLGNGGNGSGRSPQSSRPENPPRDTARRRSPRGRSSPRLDRILFLVAIGVFGIVVLTTLLSRIGRALTGGDPVPLQQGNLERIPQLYAAVLAPPTPDLNQAELTEEVAQQVVETWLSAKSAALGENHDTAALSEILVEPVLSTWQARADESIANNWYMVYEHSVTIESVEVISGSEPETEVAGDPTSAEDALTDAIAPTSATEPASDSPQQAIVLASVTENAQLHVNGQVDTDGSYNETLQVQYDLVRQDGQWRIQSMSLR